MHDKIARIEKGQEQKYPFKVDLSYTLLDWIQVENLFKEKADESKLELRSI